MKTKICKRCDKLKTLDKFGRDKRREDRRNKYCRSCARILNKKFDSKPWAGARRNSRLNMRYGITLSDRAKLLEIQQGRCALCNVTEKDYGRSLDVDHVHGSKGPKSVRGLLCNHCNRFFLPIAEKFPHLANSLVLKYLLGRPLLRII